MPRSSPTRRPTTHPRATALVSLAVLAGTAEPPRLAAQPAAQAGGQATGPREPVAPLVIPALWTAARPAGRLACAPANGPAGTPDSLSRLTDEFDDPATVAPGGRWRWFHTRYGWPSMLRRADVGATAPGQLYLEPALSGWFADNHGPFLYQTVTGDFDVTARVWSAPAGAAPNAPAALPAATWSLVGLMARAPRAVSPATWAPFRENWLFITTGTAEAPGVPVFETKSTVNSGSNLKLRPARAGWVELRLVRLRETFLLLSRLPGEGWRVRERVLRRDVPYTMQVGLTAYSDGTSAPTAWRDPRVYNTADSAARAAVGRPDLGARVDYVRFRRPPALRDVAPDWLVDHDVPEQAILEFLECRAR